MEIPIVDFARCGIDEQQVSYEEVARVGKDIFEAFANIGFVYLRNTGVPMDVVEEATQISKKFFTLPFEEKRKYAYDENYTGYQELHKEGTNPDRPEDIKESFDVGGMALGAGTINWPDADVSGFSDVMTRFYDVCRRLTKRILEVLSVGMKIKDKDYFIQCHSRIGKERNYTTLRSLFYPPVPDSLEPGQIRLGEHSDYGTLTLLFQDQIGGLEIESLDGQYIEAAPIFETVLVNIGDLLQFWTKGKLKSTKHRITIPKEEWKRKRDRQSLVYFVHPNYETQLSEIEFESTEGHYQPVRCEYENCVTAVEYVETKLRNTHR